MVEDISRLAPAGPPPAALRELLGRVALGQPSGPGDGSCDWAAVVDGLEAMAAELLARRAAAEQTERRLHAVMDMMIAMAGLDFSRSVPVDEGENILDAVSLAANMLNEELRASTVSKAYVDNIIESMVEPLIVVERDSTIRVANRAALRLSGYAAEDLIGQPLGLLFDEANFDRRLIDGIRRHGALSGVEKTLLTSARQAVPVAFSASAVSGAADAGQGIVCVMRDITDRKQAEEALRRNIAQEEIIRAQTALLAELSTPLIPISDRVMVMPLVGSLDSRRAQQIMESLLAGIASSRADTAIIDITGVPMVDTQVANALLRSAQAVRLLGARVILTGIRPEVAQTLVGLGVDLSGLATHSSLRDGIAAVLGRSAERRA